MTNTTRPIGQLKSKVTLYCEVCGCSHTRNLKINIFENTPETIEKAKEELTNKAKAKYTCRICKTIAKDVENAN